MKKYLLCLLLVPILLFSGCEPKKSVGERADISSAFEDINASFSARFGDFEAQGIFVYTPEKLTLEFTSPKTVSGLKIAVDQNEVSLSVNGLNVTKQNSAVSRQFNVFSVYSALNSAKLTGTLGMIDGKTVVSGDGFEITLDSENKVNEITIPDKRIEIKLEW